MKTMAQVAAVTAIAMIFTANAFAGMKITGTIASGPKPKILIPANPRGGLKQATGVLKFRFASPANGATLSFCVGPESNPCGMSSSFVVTVRPGEETFAIVNNAEFLNGAVLAVGQGTSSTVSFTVEIE